MAQGTSPFTATVGTTAKTCVQLLAVGGLQVEIREISIGFSGTSPTAAGILVEILRQTTAGTGSAGTVNKWDGDSVAVAATAVDTYTVEPTASDILWRVPVPGVGGVIEQFSVADGPKSVTNGRIALRVTGAADTSGLTAKGFLRFDEA